MKREKQIWTTQVNFTAHFVCPEKNVPAKGPAEYNVIDTSQYPEDGYKEEIVVSRCSRCRKEHVFVPASYSEKKIKWGMK